jgi:hypothetical protein
MADLHTALWLYSDYGIEAVPQLKIVAATIINYATEGSIPKILYSIINLIVWIYLESRLKCLLDSSTPSLLDLVPTLLGAANHLLEKQRNYLMC